MADVLARHPVSGVLRLLEESRVEELVDFCARLARLGPTTLVRLRPVPRDGAAPGAAVQAWAWTPLDVLVRRPFVAGVTDDVTVRAADLLAALREHGGTAVAGEGIALPVRRDPDWRGALPPHELGPVVERVPVAVVAGLVRAAGDALRAATEAGADARRAGDQLLDQEVLTVHRDGVPDHATGAGAGAGAGGAGVAVPLRVLLALARTGILPGPAGPAGSVGPAGPVGPTSAGGGPAGPTNALAVHASAAWLRVSGPRGAAYHRRTPGLLVQAR